MSPTAPQFMFDFGSPNAFLSHEAIPAIEKRTGLKFEYVPILLGGGTPLFRAGTHQRYRQRDVRPSSNAVHLTYERVTSAEP